MKKTVALLVAVVVFSSTLSIARAEGRFMGVKTGLILIDVSGVDNVIPVGVIYGRELDQITPGFWIEGEFNLGLLGGDVSGGGDLDIWTIAAYGAYRYPVSDTSYLKGKAGLLYEDVEIRSVSDDDINLSLGIGGGFKIDDRLTIEAEFTVIESDINFLSVGLHCRF